MAFPVKDWRNDPDTSTPLSAEALENMESRLGAYTDTQAAAAQSGAEDAAVDYTNTQISTHQHLTNQIQTGGIQDGAVTSAKLDPTLRSETTNQRGKVSNSAEETITATVYSSAPTPDRVTVTLPASGIIWVGARFVARAVTTLNVGGAGLFWSLNGAAYNSFYDIVGDDFSDLGGTITTTNLATVTTTTGGDIVFTDASELASIGYGGLKVGAGYASTTATRAGAQVLFPSMIPVRASTAGTYDIELRYKVTSASMAIRSRFLYVKAEVY